MYTLSSELLFKLPKLSFVPTGFTTTTTTTITPTTVEAELEGDQNLLTSVVSTFTSPLSQPHSPQSPQSPQSPLSTSPLRVIKDNEGSAGHDHRVNDDNDDDDECTFNKGLYPSTSKPTNKPRQVKFLPLRLGQQHIIRMPTETSLVELGLAAGSSHYAFRRPIKGELLHQHFEEIVVNGPETERRILDALAAATPNLAEAPFTTGGEGLTQDDYDDFEYRDPYYEYLDLLSREAFQRAEEEEAKLDLTITEEETEMMQRIFDEVDSLQRRERRRALAKERERLKSLHGDTEVGNLDGTKKKKQKTYTKQKSKVTTSEKKGKTTTATLTETPDKAENTLAEIPDEVVAAFENLFKYEKTPQLTKSENVFAKSFLATKKSHSGKKRKVVENEEYLPPKSLKPLKKLNRETLPPNSNSIPAVDILEKKEGEEETNNYKFDMSFPSHIQAHLNKNGKMNGEDENEHLEEDDAEYRKQVDQKKKPAQMNLSREETPAEREKRLERQRERQRRFYARETPEQRARRLNKVRMRQQMLREKQLALSKGTNPYARNYKQKVKSVKKDQKSEKEGIF